MSENIETEMKEIIEKMDKKLITCPFCHKDIAINNIVLCSKQKTCFFGLCFPDCLSGDGSADYPFTGHKIKSTKEALEKRGRGVCMDYNPISI